MIKNKNTYIDIKMTDKDQQERLKLTDQDNTNLQYTGTVPLNGTISFNETNGYKWICLISDNGE